METYWRNVVSFIFKLLWPVFRVFTKPGFSALKGSNSEFDRLNSQLECSRAAFALESKAAFDAVAHGDPVVREMIQSPEVAIKNLQDRDPTVRFLACRILDIYHSQVGHDTLGLALESIILSGPDDALITGCSVFLRFSRHYYDDKSEALARVARRLAAVSADPNKPDKLRLAAYHLLCQLCGSRKQVMDSLMSDSPLGFDTVFIKQHL